MRTAISPVRPIDLASSRFATLAQAIRTTAPVMPSRRRSVGATPCTSCSRLCPRRPSATTRGRARNRASRSPLIPSVGSAEARIPRYSGWTAARACSIETCGFRRAKRYAQYRRRSSRTGAAPAGAETMSRIVIGTKRSTGALKVVPSKPGGATPVTVRTRPLTVIDSPITSGDSSKPVRQNRCASTTSGCPPIRASTSGPKSRPAAGARPSTGKYEPETHEPRRVVVRPRHAALTRNARCAATSTNGVCPCRRSRNAG